MTKKPMTIEERLNELERQVEVLKSYYLGYSKVGSSRNLTARYKMLKEYLKVIKNDPSLSREFIQGYESAVNVFDNMSI